MATGSSADGDKIALESGSATQQTSAVTGIAVLQKVALALIAVLIALVASTLVAVNGLDCTENAHAGAAASIDASRTLSAGLPGMDGLSWGKIAALGKGTELNFYLWSPNNTYPQKWVDNVLSPWMAETHGITVNRIPAVYKGCDIAGMKLVCDVRDEVKAGNVDGGAVDLVWINGANFAAMKERSLLYGPWAPLIPNAANFDFGSPNMAYDAGVATEGYEMPFHLSQSVFLHNKEHVTTPPTTLPELVAWIKSDVGRGKFAYGSDFTGMLFVKLAFYHYAGSTAAGKTWKDFMVPFDQDLYNARASVAFTELENLEPYLYHPNASSYPHDLGGWYPSDHEDIRKLIGDGTLWMDLSYNPAEAATQILNNAWPETIDSFLLSSPGMLSDTNFMAIPVTAAHKPAALLAADHIASAGSMFKRSTPEQWGALQTFDTGADTMKEWDIAFDYIDQHASVPTVEEMQADRIPVLRAGWVQAIEASWKAKVYDA